MSLGIIFSYRTFIALSLFVVKVDTGEARPGVTIEDTIGGCSLLVVNASISPLLAGAFRPLKVVERAVKAVAARTRGPVYLGIFRVRAAFIHSIKLKIDTRTVP